MNLTLKKGSDLMNKPIKVRTKGQITLPKEYMQKLNIKEGDDLDLVITDAGELKLVPMIRIPKDQEWFWTEEWQKMEEEAEDDIRNGRVKSFDNMDDLIADLDSDEPDDWINEEEK